MAERSNGRQLSGLVVSGEDLIKQAMRNPEFGIAHLEKWAEMLQILKDIAGNRMPSVADLLARGGPGTELEVASVAEQQQVDDGRQCSLGRARARHPSRSRTTSRSRRRAFPRSPTGNRRSSRPMKRPSKQAASKSGSKTPRLTLPGDDAGRQGRARPRRGGSPCRSRRSTRRSSSSRTCWPSSRRSPTSSIACLPTSREARCSSGSRPPRVIQYKIGGRISDQVSAVFGVEAYRVGSAPSKVLGEMSEEEGKASKDVSIIMDDMHSYFERRRFQRFKTVLDEMRQQDVVGSLRQLGDDVNKENGLSIAQC